MRTMRVMQFVILGAVGFGIGLATMNATDGSQQENLTQDFRAKATSPDWSPDGREIAFSSTSGIYSMTANGTGFTNLTNNPVRRDTPTWSLDGK
jgi:Tol biopolymer transport system component